MKAVTWHVVINDLVGGWCVSNVNLPMSEHDFRKEGDPEKRGYIFAECMTQEDAAIIAETLNDRGVHR